MKMLFTLLIIGAFFSGSIFADHMDQQCKDNGFSPSLIKKTIGKIKTAIDKEDYALLAKQFHYPIRINTKEGPRLIQSATAFEKLAGVLFSKVELNVIKHSKTYFCNYSGIAFSNIWMRNFGTPTQVKGFAINISSALQLPINKNGKAILPISNVKTLTLFLKIYNQSKFDKNNQSYRLYKGHLVNQWGDNINLYHVDINNDGHKNWVVIYKNSGSANVSGISQVFAERNEQLIPMKLHELLIKQFKLKDLSQWYLHMATPAISEKKHLFYMNFGATPPVCRYLWKNGVIKLIHSTISNGHNKACLYK